MSVTEATLRQSYSDAIAPHGLGFFIQTLRDPSQKIKIKDLESRFDHSPLWKKIPHANGHLKVCHLVTKVFIEFQRHSPTKDRVIAPHIREQILGQVQIHLNILSNHIFGYTVSHWKTEPTFNQSFQNYITWEKNLH